MANNQASETTGISPLFGMYSQDLHWQCDRSLPAANDNDNRWAHTTVRMISEIHEHLWAEMGCAQDCQADNTDENRLPAPHFLPGDCV